MSLKSAKLVKASSQTFAISDANQTNLQPGSGDFSIGGKVTVASQPGSGDSGFALADKYYQNTGQREFRFEYSVNSGTAQIILRTSSGGTSGFATATINKTLVTGQTYHVGMSVNSTTNTVEIFVDGVSVGTGTVTSSIFNGTSDLCLGSTRQRNTMYIDGVMAQWRYFSANLTAEDWKKELASRNAVHEDCEADWELNGDGQDATANANHLTAYNSPTYVNNNDLTDISLYNKRDYVPMRINASQVDADLTDYVAYLDLSQISNTDFWSTVASDGADIRVFKSDGKTQLPIEVVSIDTTGETGEVHFKYTGTLSSTVDTVVRVYYNGTSEARDADALYGSQEVWSDYELVYHGGTEESTGKVTLSNTGFSTDDTTNKPFGAGSRSFDGGADDQIETNFNPTTAIGTGDVTIQNWARHPDDNDRRTMWAFGPTSGSYADILELKYGNLASDSKNTLITSRAGSSGQIDIGSNNEKDDVFRMYHVTRAGSTSTLFTDGAQVATSTNAEFAHDLNDTFSIGGFQAFTTQTMNGEIDEVRIRGSILPNGWITSEHKNQSAPATFWTELTTEEQTITSQATEIDADLEDFPLYYSLSELGASNSLWTKMLSTGSDLRVFSGDGTEEYPIDVVEVDTTAKTGHIHFKKTGTLSSTIDTDFKLVADGGSEKVDAQMHEVWSDYAFVWHGNNNEDRTSNANTLTSNGGITTGAVAGKIGSATDFDGTDDRLEVSTGTELDPDAGDLTLQSWLASDVTAFQPYLNKGIRGGTDRTYGLDTHAGGLGAIMQDSDVTNDFIAPIDGGAYTVASWKKHDAVFDRDANVSLYNDGVQTGTPVSLSTQQTSYSVSGSPLIIGCRTSTGSNRISFFNGKLQEIRIRKSTLSANWLSTEYSNQNAPATFWSTGGSSTTLKTITAQASGTIDNTRGLTLSRVITTAITATASMVVDTAKKIAITTGIVSTASVEKTGQVLSRVITVSARGMVNMIESADTLVKMTIRAYTRATSPQGRKTSLYKTITTNMNASTNQAINKTITKLIQAQGAVAHLFEKSGGIVRKVITAIGGGSINTSQGRTLSRFITAMTKGTITKLVPMFSFKDKYPKKTVTATDKYSKNTAGNSTDNN